MTRRLRQSPVAEALRNYAAAAFINLALVSTILTPPDRPQAAQTRVVTDGRRFRDTELIDCGDGQRGVLSIPYETQAQHPTIGVN
jgi:hypothetical protein